MDPETGARWSGLMAQTQKGDQQAYESLLKEIIPPLRRYLRAKVADPERLEETLQEILLGIHKARNTYRPEQSFLSWMFAIAHYKVVDFYRKKKREADFEVFTEGDLDQFEATLDWGGIEMAQEQLQSILDRLSEKQRKIVTMIKLEGFSIKQAAQKMEMSESAVKVAAHRAYQKMKLELRGPAV